VVVSRADELQRYTTRGIYDASIPKVVLTTFRDNSGPVVLFDEAAGIIHDLESALAQRDERIAELIDTRVDMAAAAADYNRARAEVPEWCKRIVHAVYVVENGEGNYIAQLEAEELLEGVSRDQLRSCGVDFP
jgi:hypothetical protein